MCAFDVNHYQNKRPLKMELHAKCSHFFFRGSIVDQNIYEFGILGLSLEQKDRFQFLNSSMRNSSIPVYPG